MGAIELKDAAETVQDSIFALNGEVRELASGTVVVGQPASLLGDGKVHAWPVVADQIYGFFLEAGSAGESLRVQISGPSPDIFSGLSIGENAYLDRYGTVTTTSNLPSFGETWQIGAAKSETAVNFDIPSSPTIAVLNNVSYPSGSGTVNLNAQAGACNDMNITSGDVYLRATTASEHATCDVYGNLDIASGAILHLIRTVLVVHGNITGSGEIRGAYGAAGGDGGDGGDGGTLIAPTGGAGIAGTAGIEMTEYGISGGTGRYGGGGGGGGSSITGGTGGSGNGGGGAGGAPMAGTPGTGGSGVDGGASGGGVGGIGSGGNGGAGSGGGDTGQAIINTYTGTGTGGTGGTGGLGGGGGGSTNGGAAGTGGSAGGGAGGASAAFTWGGGGGAGSGAGGGGTGGGHLTFVVYGTIAAGITIRSGKGGAGGTPGTPGAGGAGTSDGIAGSAANDNASSGDTGDLQLFSQYTSGTIPSTIDVTAIDGTCTSGTIYYNDKLKATLDSLNTAISYTGFSQLVLT